MKQVINYAIARLLEPTSWLAVTAFSGAVAVSLQSNSTLWIALLSGLMAVVLPETRK